MPSRSTTASRGFASAAAARPSPGAGGLPRRAASLPSPTSRTPIPTRGGPVATPAPLMKASFFAPPLKIAFAPCSPEMCT